MKQVFYDPQRKRWKRLRRILDVTAVVSTVVLVIFFLSVIKQQRLPDLLLPSQKPNFKAVNRRQMNLRKSLQRAAARRHKLRGGSALNQDEGPRAAFYVNDEPSYSSLKEHIHQIDLLFPDWLHVISPDGKLRAATSLFPVHFYDVVEANGTVHGVDPENRVRNVIKAAKEGTEVFPMLNNYNTMTGKWGGDIISRMLHNPAARESLHKQLDQFLYANPDYHGIALDFEEIPDQDETLYANWIGELYNDFHAKHLRLYVNMQVSTANSVLKAVARNSDGVILMNYDQHEESSGPGPVAAEDWFDNNLTHALTDVPKQKLICAIGNYGYDWNMQLAGKALKPTGKVLSVDDLTVQEAWQRAADAGADVYFGGDELNAHFVYDDEDEHVRHQVWFLDGATTLNELRDARQMGIRSFALWRLGSEDPSMWYIWDHPGAKDAPEQLTKVPPGNDVNVEGEGSILRIISRPQSGTRTVDMDSDNFNVTDEHMTSLPRAYTVRQYGYHPKKFALTFDDGPDPTWTPKILDVLEKYHVPATFMVIGEEGEAYPGLLKRYLRDGDEIGNHTFTHPDISEISTRQLDLELNLTERLFAAELGVQPLFFRPPYSIDQEPDTNDQAAPADHIQQMGYTIIGDKIDTDDWNEHPRKTPQEITDNVLNAIATMKNKPWMRGSIILMHDGGGNRSATVAALPLLITTLRAKGYQFVQVSDLMGKTRAEVMPPISPRMRWQARIDWVAFFVFSIFGHFFVTVFFIGDVLMCARLVIIGVFALIDRIRKRKIVDAGRFEPRIAVLVPAYNEETVIVRTVHSVLNSDYRNLRIVVIDDGSKDRTVEVIEEAFAADIAAGRLTVLTKPNAGKAEALNFALNRLDEEFYVGIDADTVIASDAISKLICHFSDEHVGAVAGNAKVGNRVNLWTRWQALEYITSQNFERRALDLFDVVTVVPGAIGAWRTVAVLKGGCYPINTVAEDADLTMNLLEQGYKVIYEDRALAFTEAPVTANGLMRQRFRWSFGILQAVFKHKHAFKTNRAMGYFALPNILIFQILLPLVSPFIDLIFLAGTLQYLWDRYFHPETASAANFEKLLTYFLAFLVIDFVTSTLAFALERRHPANKGDGWLLFHIWLQRFAYRQLFSLVLFKTIKRAVDGRPFNWDKLERTAKMSKRTEQITAGS